MKIQKTYRERIQKTSMDDIRYPVGPCVWPSEVSAEERQQHIRDIAEMPARLREAVAGLAPQHLDIPYREGGWSIRQIVHHIPDSHLNAYIRFKLALTEDQPTIKPYKEDLWAKLSDSKDTPVEVSLTLLESRHDRWLRLLRALTPADLKRTLNHPEMGVVALDRYLALYAWHG